jgi:hypothetical protein
LSESSRAEVAARGAVNLGAVAGVTVLGALGVCPPLYALGALVLIAMPTHAGHVIGWLTGRAPAPELARDTRELREPGKGDK